MLLLAGCSFTDNVHFPTVAFGPNIYDSNYAKILARGGAGNQYIAQSILDNLTPDVDKVFVLWSGMSRIDIPLPKPMEPEIEVYWHRSHGADAVWFHSGGFGGSWHSRSRYNYSKWIYDCLTTQYTPMDWNYLASLSLSVIAGCLNTLEALNIDYRFGWIYDIFSDYSDKNTSLNGSVSKDHHLLKTIPWHKCLNSTPFEFCRDRNLLDPTDDFHPTAQGYQEWWNSVQDQVPFLLT
jgi:hypothetical protein